MVDVISREIVLLVNAKSRSGAKKGQEARDALVSAGFTVSDYKETVNQAAFETALDRYIQENRRLIAIGGGDGTMRLGAEKIAGSESTMVLVPLGTGNAWAGDLGVPVGPAETAAALANSEVQAIDLGIADGRGFVNVATIGLTALIVKNLPKGFKGKFGRLVYLPAVIRSLSELRPFELTVKTEGDQYQGMALQFVAAAGRTHAGPFRVTTRSSNQDGRLSLYALDDTDRTGLAKFGLGLLTGRHTYLSEVWSCEAATASVTTRPAKKVIVDGEPSGTAPMKLSIKPHALKVLVPKTEEEPST